MLVSSPAASAFAASALLVALLVVALLVVALLVVALLVALLLVALLVVALLVVALLAVALLAVVLLAFAIPFATVLPSSDRSSPSLFVLPPGPGVARRWPGPWITMCTMPISCLHKYHSSTCTCWICACCMCICWICACCRCICSICACCICISWICSCCICISWLCSCCICMCCRCSSTCWLWSIPPITPVFIINLLLGILMAGCGPLFPFFYATFRLLFLGRLICQGFCGPRRRHFCRHLRVLREGVHLQGTLSRSILCGFEFNP